MNNIKSKLHVLVDSREPSVSFAKLFFENSRFTSLGIVEHIRGINFAERLEVVLRFFSPGDEILISMHYLPENQLEEASTVLKRNSSVKVYVAAFDCFEHMKCWCLESGIDFIGNPYKQRKKPKGNSIKELITSKDEALRRIWVQYRLMLAIISRVDRLGQVCKQLIKGFPIEGDTLEKEYVRALRFFEQGEPDMAGGSYSCEESQVLNPIDDLRARINTIAATDFNVLIKGDSGTGKETVAWAIHELSSRRDQPFFALNCAGLPDELLESEMFGYRKGSHNQAYGDSIGILETANGGTLFLDELPEMSLRIQAKLLRFVENGEYRPLGSTENRYSDIRIIAAGQPRRIDDTSVRPDLKSRIGQLDVELLPLRELEKKSSGTLFKIAFILLERYTWTTIYNGNRIRELTPADIRKFQEKLAQEHNLELLTAEKWKESNIRELNNFLRKWIVFGDRELQNLSRQNLLPNGIGQNGAKLMLYDDQLEAFLIEPKNREELKRMLSTKPLRNLKKSYIRHLYTIYSIIVEYENETLDLPKKPTQKELAKLMGITENTISRHLN